MSNRESDKRARLKYKQKCLTITCEICPRDAELIEYILSTGEPKSTVMKRLARLGLAALKKIEELKRKNDELAQSSEN